MHPSEWGRADATGAVYVRTADGERLVGEYPDATQEEALAYFVRKFVELEGQVALLEQRAQRGAPPADLAKTADHLATALETANAVGDLASLADRVAAVRSAVSELTAQQEEASREALAAAITERTAIVEEAEALAARDLSTARWKEVGATIDALFARWQTHQSEGPRLPSAVGDRLWKRFSAARTTIEKQRRAFFAKADAAQKDVRAAKQSLVERAEALAPKGGDGVAEYRALLDEWKRAGHAGKRLDDQLWERFKAAGDVLYSAKAAAGAREDAEFGANLEAKLALLAEGDGILGITDAAEAKRRYAAFLVRWEAVGKVPRDRVKALDDRVRRLEAHVRGLENEHWRRTNPERKEREEGFVGQLQDAIAGLERELADAEAATDAKRVAEAKAALEARRAWLAAVSGS